jgi:hypothetical protein
VLAITPIRILLVYGAKRLDGILSFGQSVFDEMQQRANKFPPAQRQAALDAMKRDRARIGQEVLARLKQEKEFSDAFSRAFWLAFWAIALPLVCWFFSTR